MREESWDTPPGFAERWMAGNYMRLWQLLQSNINELYATSPRAAFYVQPFSVPRAWFEGPGGGGLHGASAEAREDGEQEKEEGHSGDDAADEDGDDPMDMDDACSDVSRSASDTEQDECECSTVLGEPSAFVVRATCIIRGPGRFHARRELSLSPGAATSNVSYACARDFCVNLLQEMPAQVFRATLRPTGTEFVLDGTPSTAEFYGDPNIDFAQPSATVDFCVRVRNISYSAYGARSLALADWLAASYDKIAVAAMQKQPPTPVAASDLAPHAFGACPSAADASRYSPLPMPVPLFSE